MRFFTSDEVGLLKKINILPESEPIITTYGKIDRTSAIRKIHQTKNSITLAKSNGWASTLSTETGAEINAFNLFQHQLTPDGNPRINKNKKQEQTVGLYVDDESNSILSCTNFGNLVHILTETGETTQFSLMQDNLTCMTANPTEKNKFITGGQERDICLWDLNNLSNKLEPIWKAKNVKNDYLDLRRPVWIRNIKSMDENVPFVWATCTEYHQVRIYDTRTSQRPSFNLSIGENPLRCLNVYDSNQIICGSNCGDMYTIDIRNKKMLNNFKGINGAITQIHSVSSAGLVACTSIDRFLRIYHQQTRKLVHKIFLKQRLTDLAIDLESIVENGALNDFEMLWSGLPPTEAEPEK